MLNIVVIDDEPLALEILQGYLHNLADVGKVSLFNAATAALEHVKQHKPDLLLLDIEMPGMNGLDFLGQLADPPLTIFTTAYRNYAFEGFELGVIDFLLKPISFARFSAAIQKATDFISLQTRNTEFEKGATAPAFIFVKSGLTRIKLYFDQISHVQGLKDYAIIYTPGQKIVVKGSVKMIQEMFPPSLFVRVHKSFLVAVKSVKRIERNRILVDGHQIPIGRFYREGADRKLME